MGEKSKLIGEYGEKSVQNFLKLVGWVEPLKNLQFKCNNVEHLNDKGNPKQTHGIDFMYSYLSPLVDGVLNKVHISSKYTDKPYPNSPNAKLKDYCQDIITAVDCFDKSEKSRDIIKNKRDFSTIENSAVLFWLSSDPDTYFDLISKVNNLRVSFDSVCEKLYIVDNKRIDFIYKAVSFCKGSFTNHDTSFFYPDTGKNINPISKMYYGKVLPVEYINSSILPVRIEETNTGLTSLVILSIDAFDKEDLKRLMDLAQRLNQSWTGKVIIAFSEYNEVRFQEDVQLVKSMFDDIKIKQDLVVM
jgi:hypothetical protein